MWGGLIEVRAKAKTEAGPSLRLKSAYGQDDGLLWGDPHLGCAGEVVVAEGKNMAPVEALVIPPMRGTAAHGWGTHFVVVRAKGKNNCKGKSRSFPPAEKRLRSG